MGEQVCAKIDSPAPVAGPNSTPEDPALAVPEPIPINDINTFAPCGDSDFMDIMNDLLGGSQHEQQPSSEVSLPVEELATDHPTNKFPHRSGQDLMEIECGFDIPEDDWWAFFQTIAGSGSDDHRNDDDDDDDAEAPMTPPQQPQNHNAPATPPQSQHETLFTIPEQRQREDWNAFLDTIIIDDEPSSASSATALMCELPCEGARNPCTGMDDCHCVAHVAQVLTNLEAVHVATCKPRYFSTVTTGIPGVHLGKRGLMVKFRGKDYLSPRRRVASAGVSVRLFLREMYCF